MKKIIFIVFALLSFEKAIAQNVNYGIKTGVNLSKSLVNYDTALEYKNILGYQIGGFVKVKLTEKLFLQPELLYILQGSKAELNSVLLFDSIDDQQFNSNGNIFKSKESNIILPIILKYYLSQNFNIEFGPQLDYLFNEKFSNDIDTEGSAGSINYSGGSLSEFNFGLDLGVGYKISNKVGVGLRYNYGFNRLDSELFKEGNFKLRNSVFQLNFEYDIN